MERNKQVTARLTEVEHGRLAHAASEVGMTISEYIRSIAANGIEKVVYDPEFTDAMRDLHSEARRIASAIQQMASEKKDLEGAVALRLAEAQVLELNKKLRFIEERLKEDAEGRD